MHLNEILWTRRKERVSTLEEREKVGKNLQPLSVASARRDDGRGCQKMKYVDLKNEKECLNLNIFCMFRVEDCIKFLR